MSRTRLTAAALRLAAALTFAPGASAQAPAPQDDAERRRAAAGRLNA
ncbi:MAG TPA: hypothetical protein VF621_18115 [Pyrinomonadaceae bacterium]